MQKLAGLGTQEEVVNFEVKIKVLDSDNNLRPGMSCNTDIQTETVNNVLSVPIQSVTTRSDVNLGINKSLQMVKIVKLLRLKLKRKKTINLKKLFL